MGSGLSTLSEFDQAGKDEPNTKSKLVNNYKQLFSISLFPYSMFSILFYIFNSIFHIYT